MFYIESIVLEYCHYPAIKMSFAASTFLQLVLLLTWTCLSTFSEEQTHPIFRKVLSSQVILEQLFSSASLVFAPGLFELIQAIEPPTVSYFKSLPTNFKKKWAVYLLLLEKPGCRPNIYIGSGTQATSGVSARLADYTHGKNVPRYVHKALNDGYSIVHQGLLCWTQIPPPALRPVSRAVILALEATFAFVFRAMRPVKQDYGMSHICPWPRDTLEYDGLCSHCALTEAVPGDHGLFAEELEAQAAEIKGRRADYYHEWRNRTQSEDPETYYAKSNKNRKAYVKRNPGAQKEADKRTIAKAVAQKKFHCAICDHTFTKKAKLTKHLTGPKHAEKAALARKQQSSDSC